MEYISKMLASPQGSRVSPGALTPHKCSYTPQIFIEVPAVCQLLAQAVSFTWDAFSLPLPNPDPTYPLTLNANDISAPRPSPQAVPVLLSTCL